MADHFAIPETLPAKVEQKPLSKCDRCGWVFALENPKFRCFDPKDLKKVRKEPRTEIALRAGGKIVTRCDVCYEEELWHAGRHREQTGVEAETYRKGIFGKVTSPERK